MKYEVLKEVLDTVKGSTFAGIDTKTVVALKGGKKNPYKDRLFKITEDSNVILFSNVDDNPYENMVKRRMLAEGKDPDAFTVGKRAWGTRVGKSPFIEHKDKYYLECFFRSGGKTRYVLDTGEEVDPTTIEGFEKKETNSETSQGGIEDKVIIRTFSLDSITEVRIKHEVLTS